MIVKGLIDYSVRSHNKPVAHPVAGGTCKATLVTICDL